MATNPALQPAQEPMEGDNLTPQQAKLILTVFEADPDAVIAAAEELEMSEDDVDNLLSYLSEEGGEEDDEEPDEDDEEEDEANPEGTI